MFPFVQPKPIPNVLLLPMAILLLLFSMVSAQTPITMGPQISTYSGGVRGYYFVAPVNFTICQLYVEDELNTQMQHVEVVRLNGVPPTYPSSTNSFTSLFYQNNWVPNAPIPCNIPISAGQIIGVYGARGNGTTMYNSYGPSPWTATVYTSNFDCYYSGMQSPLNNQQMHDIWYANFNRTGRVTMYYDCTILDDRLLDFAAIPSGDDALLSWVVDSDAELSRFELERSQEGVDFSMVDSRPFVAGIGEASAFSHKDVEVAGRTSFYRLRLIGKNGETSYSNIERVSFEGQDGFSIYPNPMEVGSSIRLRIPEPAHPDIRTRFSLSDLQGRELYAGELEPAPGRNHCEIDPGVVAAGVYVLRLQQGQTVAVKRLVVR